jgi:hypothetical protein
MVNHIERCNELLGETVTPEFRTISILARIPGNIKMLASKVFKFVGETRLSSITALGRPQTSQSIL